MTNEATERTDIFTLIQRVVDTNLSTVRQLVEKDRATPDKLVVAMTSIAVAAKLALALTKLQLENPGIGLDDLKDEICAIKREIDDVPVN